MTEVLRSEWTKIYTVRSTMWMLVATVVTMLGLAVMASVTAVLNDLPKSPDPIKFTLGGTQLAVLLMATLGVLVISGEYRTGMIRTTLLAVPRRIRMLSGKVLVFAVAALVTSLITILVTFFASQAVLGDLGTTLGAPGVLGALVGSALYLTASGLFGLALGALIRHTPGAIIAAICLMVVLPGLVQSLPGEWGPAVSRYFTTTAGQQITFTRPVEGALGPWEGFGVYCVWIAVIMIIATIFLRRRDA
ncbi:ABC-2 transporter permease [Streptosporangium soli]|nr:ABC transporter permease [Streptosporangium sp. KLBMP 9127]